MDQSSIRPATLQLLDVGLQGFSCVVDAERLANLLPMDAEQLPGLCQEGSIQCLLLPVSGRPGVPPRLQLQLSSDMTLQENLQEQPEIAAAEAFSKLIAAAREAEANHQREKEEWEQSWAALQSEAVDTAERLLTLEAELAIAKEATSEARQAVEVLEEAKRGLEAEKEWMNSMLRTQRQQAAAADTAREACEKERDCWKESAERHQAAADHLAEELLREQGRGAALVAENRTAEEALAAHRRREEELQGVQSALTERGWHLAGEVRELRQKTTAAQEACEQHGVEREEWRWAQAQLQEQIATELQAAKATAIEAVAQRDRVAQRLAVTEAYCTKRLEEMLEEVAHAKDELLKSTAHQKASKASLAADLTAAVRRAEQAEAEAVAARAEQAQALAAAAAQCDRLREEVRAAEAAQADLHTERQWAASLLQTEGQRLAEAEGALARLQAQLTRERREWERVEAVLYQDLAEMRSTAKEAERRHKEEEAALRDTLAIHVTEREELWGTVGTLRGELQAARDAGAGLQAELEAAKRVEETLRLAAVAMAERYERERCEWAEMTESTRMQFEEELGAMRGVLEQALAQLHQVPHDWRAAEVKFEAEMEQVRAAAAQEAQQAREAQARHERELAQLRHAEADLQAELVTAREDRQAEGARAAILEGDLERTKALWAEAQDHHERYRGQSEATRAALESETAKLRLALEAANERVTEIDFKLKQAEARHVKDVEHQRAITSDVRVRLTAAKDELELELARLSSDLAQHKAEAAEVLKRFTREKSDLEDTVAELQEDVLHFVSKAERQRQVISELLLKAEAEAEAAAAAHTALAEGRRQWQDAKAQLMRDVVGLNALAEKVIEQRHQVTEGWWQAEAELTAELTYQKRLLAQATASHTEQQEAWRRVEATLQHDRDTARIQLSSCESQLAQAVQAEATLAQRQRELEHAVTTLTTDLALVVTEHQATTNILVAVQQTVVQQQEAAIQQLSQWQQQEAAWKAEAAAQTQLLADAQQRAAVLANDLAEARLLAEETHRRHVLCGWYWEAKEASVAADWTATSGALGQAWGRAAALEGELRQATAQHARHRQQWEALEMGLRADVADLTAALHAEAEKATGLAEALRGAEEAAAEAKAQHEQIQVGLQAEVADLSAGLQAAQQRVGQLVESLAVETAAAAEARARHMAQCEEWTVWKIELQTSNAALTQELDLQRERARAGREAATQAKREVASAQAEMDRLQSDAASATVGRGEAAAALQREWQRLAEEQARLRQGEARSQQLLQRLAQRDEELRQRRQEMAAAAVMYALKESEHVEATKRLLAEAADWRRQIQDLSEELKQLPAMERALQRSTTEIVQLKCSLAVQQKAFDQQKSDGAATAMALGFLRCIDNISHMPAVIDLSGLLSAQGPARPVRYAGAALEAGDVLRAVRRACHRPQFAARCRAAGHVGPPTAAWLLREMEREWAGGGEALWRQATEDAGVAPAAGEGAEGEAEAGDLEAEGQASIAERPPAAVTDTMAGLMNKAEMVALRLSLGPARRLLDHTLRCRSGRFAATQWALDCALGKLATRPPAPAGPLWLRCPAPPLLPPPAPADARRAGPQLWWSPAYLTAAPVQQPGADGEESLCRLAVEPSGLPGFACGGADVRWAGAAPEGADPPPPYLLPSGTLLVPGPPAEPTDSSEERILRPYFVWDATHRCPVVGDEDVWLPLAAALWRLLMGGEVPLDTNQALRAIEEGDGPSLPDGLDAVPDWLQWLTAAEVSQHHKLHWLQAEEEEQRQQLVKAATVESAALFTVATAAYHSAAVLQRMAAAQELWRSAERQRQGLLRRELEVQRLEETLKSSHPTADNTDRDGWLGQLSQQREEKPHVAALHFDSTSQMRELAIMLAKERVLERFRVRHLPQGSAFAALAAARPASSGGPRPPSPQDDAVLLGVWNAEHQLQQLNEQLHDCVLKMKRFHRQVMRVFSDGIGGAAAVDDLFSLLEGGTEGTAPSDVVSRLQQMGELGDLNALYREGHQALEAMAAVVQAAKLSLTPHLPPPSPLSPHPADLASSWPPRRAAARGRPPSALLSPSQHRASTRPPSAGTPLRPLSCPRGGLRSKASVKAFLREAYGL